MLSSIFFIEDLDQINSLKGLIHTDTIIISTIPAVSVELKKRSIPFQTTIDFFGIEGHRYVLNKSCEIVEELRPLLSQIDNENVRHAFEKSWIFYFRFHLHYFLSMLYIIDQAVKKYKPDLLISIPNSFEKISKIDSCKTNYLLNEIVECYAKSNDIQIQNTKKRKKCKSKNNNFSTSKNLIKKIIFKSQLSILKLLKKNKNSILVLEDTYGMPNLISKISQHLSHSFPVYLTIQRNSLKTRLKEVFKGEGYFFLFIPSNAKPTEYADFQAKITLCTSSIRSYFYKKPELTTIFGLNIDNFLLDYIENTLSPKMHRLNGELISLKEILKISKPEKVFSQHSLDLGYALGEICLESNISALLISHGSHVPNNNLMAKLEWSIHSQTIFNAHYPFIAIQTPWANKFINNQDEVISKKIITGPLIIAQKDLNIKNRLLTKKKLFNIKTEKRIILHAGTPKSWNSLRPWVYETFDEYINNINDVIEAVGVVPDLFLAIRFRPQSGLSLDDLKLSLIKSDCYSIYVEGSFKDYLMASDFLLSYSSTTIEEALQYNVPVIQYDSDGKYEHISALKLNNGTKNNISPVYSVLSSQDLIPALYWLNENHKYNDNDSISWSDHTFKAVKNMDWLHQMDLR